MMTDRQEVQRVEKNAEICIIGAAAAGLCAAVVAKRNGIDKIVVLEKNHTTGGTAVMSAGIMAYGSSTQKRQGLFYDVDEVFLDIITMQNWNCDPKLVRKWISGTAESIDFIEGLGGCRYELAVTETADPSKFRCSRHIMAEFKDGKFTFKRSGLTLMNRLRDVCADLGVEIICDCKAEHLIEDSAGRIVGVGAVNKDGEELSIKADATILATGSFANNRELIRELYGVDQYADSDFLIASCFPWNTGDGITMAREVGAAKGKPIAFFISPHSHFEGTSEILCTLMRRGHGMTVNRNGERFCDEAIWTESEWGWMKGTAVDNQPGRVCYTIWDQALVDLTVEDKEYQLPGILPSMLDRPMYRGNGYWGDAGYDPANWKKAIPDHLRHDAEIGRVGICRTVGEMAAFIGCDEEILQETIDNYNMSCLKKYDAEFLKNPNYLYPVLKPPYYVMRGDPGIDTAIGGIKIDNCQRVLAEDDNVIPGLYAAGVCCSCWSNGQYVVNGSAMSFTVYSGRAAGKEAAAYIKKTEKPVRKKSPAKQKTSDSDPVPSWSGGWN
jgi:fumarate reductase flavoprotein subunit